MSTETTSIPVEIAVRTDPGRDPDKQVNEDSALHVETHLGLLAIVCDGMGGHAGGKEASELAVNTIVELVRGAPPITKPRDALRVAIEEANRRVWSMSTSEGGYRPGSTVVALLAHPGGAEIAHVGDSRIYYVHAGAIAQITKDHSMVQEMVDRQLLRPEEAATHPEANKILRALGIAKDVEVELRSEPVPFVGGDVFVLCSDGLSDLVSPTEILDVAGSKPAAQSVYQLVEMANARGGHDNITVMCVRMKGTAAPVDAATVVKTMQLTVEDGQGLGQAPSTGPHGTVLAMPAQPGAPAGVQPAPSAPSSSPTGAANPTQLVAPVAFGAPPSSNPHANARRSASSPKAGGPPPIAWIGVALGLVALVLAGVFLWSMNRPRRKAVPLVDAGEAVRDNGATGEAEIDAAPELPETPTLPSSETLVCVQARRAREAGRPDSIIRALEARCRESMAPAPSSTPAPLPTPTPTLAPTPTLTPAPTSTP